PARDAAAAPAGSPSPVEAFRSRCWRRGFSPTSGRPTDHTPEPFAAAPACRGRLFLVAIVHSAVGNAAKRHLIRRTWASISNIGGRRLATVFVVGRSADQDENRRLDKESEEFGDLVVANFRDHYRNLTYKNLYGIRWALEHCSGVRFVLKTDDDVLVNTFRLVEYISDRLLETRNFFYCMTAKQETRMSDPQYKWFVSPSEWPVQEYPLHCKGLAYLFSADLLGPLHLCAQWRNYFWIDDIFVTGAVAHECLGAALLHWAPGWDFSYLNPSLTGLQLTQAVVFNEFDSEPVPALTANFQPAKQSWTRVAALRALYSQRHRIITMKPLPANFAPSDRPLQPRQHVYGGFRQHRRRRHQHSWRADAADQDEEVDAGCAECEEFLRRHSACISAAGRALSCAYLLLLSTLICLYLFRLARSLALGAAPLDSSALPANPLQCFELTLPASNSTPEWRLAASCVRLQLQLTAPSPPPPPPPPPLSLSFLRLQHIDGALLTVPSSDASVFVLQPGGFYKDCGQSAGLADLRLANKDSASACGSLSVTRLAGGGCPLSFLLFADMQLRLQLGLRLLRFADELDSARSLTATARPLLPVLSPATELDDFGVDRQGRLRLINPARLRLLPEEPTSQRDADGLEASAENSDDDLDDLLPDPAGDVDGGSGGGSGGDTGGSAEVDAEEPAIPDPTMTPENLNDLKDIWSNPDIPEVKLERPKPKYSPNEQLRNTMGGRGFRRPRLLATAAYGQSSSSACFCLSSCLRRRRISRFTSRYLSWMDSRYSDSSRCRMCRKLLSSGTEKADHCGLGKEPAASAAAMHRRCPELTLTRPESFSCSTIFFLSNTELPSSSEEPSATAEVPCSQDSTRASGLSGGEQRLHDLLAAHSAGDLQQAALTPRHQLRQLRAAEPDGPDQVDVHADPAAELPRRRVEADGGAAEAAELADPGEQLLVRPAGDDGLGGRALDLADADAEGANGRPVPGVELVLQLRADEAVVPGPGRRDADSAPSLSSKSSADAAVAAPASSGEVGDAGTSSSPSSVDEDDRSPEDCCGCFRCFCPDCLLCCWLRRSWQRGLPPSSPSLSPLLSESGRRTSCCCGCCWPLPERRRVLSMTVTMLFKVLRLLIDASDRLPGGSGDSSACCCCLVGVASCLANPPGDMTRSQFYIRLSGMPADSNQTMCAAAEFRRHLGVREGAAVILELAKLGQQVRLLSRMLVMRLRMLRGSRLVFAAGDSSMLRRARGSCLKVGGVGKSD
uniref:Hexosyltransferase n=1 Tax=Macrostomum lignano TaxID=282301 RepID=A0A1I8I5Z5_9PLAT